MGWRDRKLAVKIARVKAFEDQRGRCYWCSTFMTCRVEGDPRRLCTAEHLQPQAQMGWHTDRNIVAACRWCNQIRGNRSVSEWLPALVQSIASRMKAPDDWPGIMPFDARRTKYVLKRAGSWKRPSATEAHTYSVVGSISESAETA